MEWFDVNVRFKKNGILLCLIFLLMGCDGNPWNSPYPASQASSNIFYTSFVNAPKTLDPARSYTSEEWMFISQIYEPLLQYHYLKRPYELIPLTLKKMPSHSYYDKEGKRLKENAPVETIAYTVFDFELLPHIFYQPHPCFAKDVLGHYRYHHLSDQELSRIRKFSDFNQVGTRELVADDYILEVKRLADPRVHSPLFGLLAENMVGFSEFSKRLEKKIQSKEPIVLSEEKWEGANRLSPTHWQFKIKGKYPQMMYWFATTFFSPIPWEALVFYEQPTLSSHDITLDSVPVGTGAYLMSELLPNQRIVLSKNPSFHGEFYPKDGNDQKYSEDAGKPLPFIDQVVFSSERESIPRWNKFLQGYYDNSSIGSDSFAQAISMGMNGPTLTEAMKQLGIRLEVSTDASIFYMGFNMQDPVVGGTSERARLLRQAISIAMNYEEYISIFLNGRGESAMGPLPPGIFGYEPGEKGDNPYVFHWIQGKPVRKSLEEAKALLVQAGYPHGKDASTGYPLLLHYDAVLSSGPDEQAYFSWLRKQFDELGIELDIRATDYNRFQEKISIGHTQIFSWGWNADYPDPENFLFLFYGKNKRTENGGENVTNYSNPEYDMLFQKMRNMENTVERQKIITQMVHLLQRDAPWVYGFIPQQYMLRHQWIGSIKPHNIFANNTMKYIRIDPRLRYQCRQKWNPPRLLPLFCFGLFCLCLLIPVGYLFWRKEYTKVSSKCMVFCK